MDDTLNDDDAMREIVSSQLNELHRLGLPDFHALVRGYEAMTQICANLALRFTSEPLPYPEAIYKHVDKMLLENERLRDFKRVARERADMVVACAEEIQRDLNGVKGLAYGIRHEALVSELSTDERASSASDQPRSADAGASAESGRG